MLVMTLGTYASAISENQNTAYTSYTTYFEDGSYIIAEGLAKPADVTASKLKVTFLPSWIRWLPVGRADYWVLARDADYKTALVGTPDKKYLWLLARSPNVSQETYAKYRQIAQQQGYDLKEFKLTSQSKQTVDLIP